MVGGVPPHHPDLAEGVPPNIKTWPVYSPHPQMLNRQTPVKTVPSLVLRTRAAKMEITAQNGSSVIFTDGAFIYTYSYRRENDDNIAFCEG